MSASRLHRRARSSPPWPPGWRSTSCTRRAPAASATSASGCQSRSSPTATMIRPGTPRRPTRCRWRCWCCWRASRLSSEPCCCFTTCSTTVSGDRGDRRQERGQRAPARHPRQTPRRAAPPRFQTTREQRDELARRFFAAAEQGDLAGLEALLAHDVELTGDGGGKVPALARSLRGRNRVARTLINWVRLAARLPGVSWRPVEVNGGPGALFLDEQQRLIGVGARYRRRSDHKHQRDRQPRQAEAPRATGRLHIATEEGRGTRSRPKVRRRRLPLATLYFMVFSQTSSTLDPHSPKGDCS